MTPTYLSTLTLIAALLLFAGIYRLAVATGHDAVIPDPPPVPVAYEPLVRCYGAPLPEKPDGKQSLKAEIAQTPPGRHRAPEPTAAEVAAAIAVGKAELRDAAHSNRDSYPALGYAHKAGVGRYAHLRIEELDATAERRLKLDGLGITVQPSVFGTPETIDEWVTV